VRPVTVSVSGPRPEVLPTLELAPALLPVWAPEGAEGAEVLAGEEDEEEEEEDEEEDEEEPVPVPAPSAGIALVVLPRPGTRLLAGDMPGMTPLTVDRLEAGFARLPPVTADEEEEPQAAPVAPVSAEERGRLACSQRTPAAADPPSAWVRPLSDAAGTPVDDTACASAGAAKPIVRVPAAAAPPSKIRQLYTKAPFQVGQLN